jgi:hypothetical protein
MRDTCLYLENKKLYINNLDHRNAGRAVKIRITEMKSKNDFKIKVVR